MAMIPLTPLLRKIKIFYQLKKKSERIIHEIFMDDLKLFAKCSEEVDSIRNSVRIVPDKIKTIFGLSKCAVLILKKGKVIRWEGMIMRDRQIIKRHEKDCTFKHLGILEADRVKHERMMEQTAKRLLDAQGLY